jgi:transcriptional regulator with PAS, ATPase and Fis domain
LSGSKDPECRMGRIIAATIKNLEQMIEAGSFREDLTTA